MSNQISAVVFDMDGVIFDTETRYIQCWRQVGARHGIEAPYMDRASRAVIGITESAASNILAQMVGDRMDPKAAIAETDALFRETYGYHVPVMKGVEEILSRLKNAGISTAIASSSKYDVVLAELKASGINGYFDALICGDMVTRSKPAPDIFLKACEVLGADPSLAFGIEDSYNGVRAIHAAGMRPIMVPDQLPPTDEMVALAETIEPDLIAAADYILGTGKSSEVIRKSQMYRI